ncbi:Autophagy-related protein 17 [Cyphellophora attinorum]|uniref:Autophagy-related protein 17 n=1 Tax=Cyphellophora attinorum TaxID=1664694 RepID=A0A0N0NHE7_9EURO|nr:Autophagy-related protein 17 [Phialophora attinorum]KPI34478.1 Autophagy-related protein 17 [Phialophora attinorum]
MSLPVSTASLNRASNASSPSQSGQQAGPVTIDTLISYLVAAKRSLSSIHHVHRATTVLAEARSAIESTAALIARTTYLRRSLQSQLKILRGIQYELEGSANAVQGEFQALIQELDAAGKSLEHTIQRLKSTRIEDAFKPPPTPSEDQTSAVAPKDTLYDFVEESPAEQIRDAMKEVIDTVQDNQEETTASIRNLEDDLQIINDLLTDRQDTSTSISDDYVPPDLTHLLRQLESYAHSMAQSLESLVKHFDLCATAIKHTEGAGAAVLRKYKAGNLPADVDVINEVEGPTEPMNDAERLEMLSVLQNDAAEVDDVVLEIAGQADDMDAHLNEILHWRRRHERTHRDVSVEAFRRLETLGAKLSGFVAASNAAAQRWAASRESLNDGIAGMEDLEATYTNFLHAYDRLIIEAARRRSVKKQMERIVEDSQRTLDNLYEKDLGERQMFREELGDFLPSDIWEGLHLGPARWDVRRVDQVREGKEEEGWLSVPELERGVVEAALRRVRADGEAARS